MPLECQEPPRCSTIRSPPTLMVKAAMLRPPTLEVVLPSSIWRDFKGLRQRDVIAADDCGVARLCGGSRSFVVLSPAQSWLSESRKNVAPAPQQVFAVSRRQ